ncbi:MAG: FtsX-like permease family protein [Oscillospiraceae bacterium]|nr:FtsX-like permease family protein [Oscillospiraceae bacterium]
MVKRNAAGAIIWRTIRGSLGRYLAILAIIALGSGFFAGLQVARSAMVKTADTYLREQKFYDFRLLSTLGFSEADVEAVSAVSGVAAAESAVSADFIADDGSENSVVLSAHSVTEQVNTLELVAGRMPEAADECVLDAYRYGEEMLGMHILVSEENDQDTLDQLSCSDYTVVGLAYSPLYLNYERGSSAIGSGTVAAFVFLTRAGFTSDDATELYVSLGSETPELYSDAYAALTDRMEQPLLDALESRKDARYEEVTGDARQELLDGKAELLDGWREYVDKEADGENELASAQKKLDDARATLDQGWADYQNGCEEYDSAIADAEAQLSVSHQQLDQAGETLTAGQKSYDAGAAKLAEGEFDYQTGLAQYESGNAAYQSYLAAYEEGKAQYDAGEEAYETGLTQSEEAQEALGAARAELDQNKIRLDQSESTYTGMAAFLASGASAVTNPAEWAAYSATLDALLDQFAGAGDYALNEANLAMLRAALDAAQTAYAAGESEYQSGLLEYQEGAAALADSRATLDATAAALADSKAQLDATAAELASAKAVLDNSRKTLDDGAAQLASSKAALDQGLLDYQSGLAAWQSGQSELAEERETGKQTLADSLTKLQDGEAEYESGLADLESGKTTLRKETGNALAELLENRQKLQDGWAKLSEVEPATFYVLDRTLNTGYACFDNDSQIVDGIARVFPLFFFLVAALVCITTMTRMVEDDRTQIGIMKALGYGNFAISRKYLIYAGSASLLGCVIGLSLGSWLIPRVLWKAYSIMYGFAPIQFFFNWKLSILSTLGYLCCALGATWISCRGELREVSAELIRPKAPKPGKRVLLERIPLIWKHLGFLRKVSFRNVFRYKKRLFMMIVGIGGCTALLLTGFGIHDSIQNFVGYQFDEITKYDCTVTFSDPMSDETQQEFLDECADGVKSAAFVHLSSVNVESDSLVKSAYLVATDDDLTGYMDFHSGGEELSYPETGQCLINKNLSEQFDLRVGDTVTVYDSDRNSLTMTISGIFDNYIYNYIYTTAGTLDGYGGNREIKCAYVNLTDGEAHSTALAEVAGASGVSGVSSNEVLRNRIETMMSSLNYIVVFVTLCAGALAFIVLYNLTNINITERIREIATIKVLGFYEGETSTYVFRENLILTSLGALLGLPLGKLLHLYVMGQIKIDMMRFDVRVTILSYVSAVLLTLAFAGIVNFVMLYKIRKIDMAESLKSVE